MKRITLDDIQLAYHQTGYLPATGKWLDYCDRGRECCGLSAMAISSGGLDIIKSLRDYTKPGNVAMQDLANHLAISFDYANGFMHGWDNEPSEDDPDQSLEFQLGFSDGSDIINYYLYD